MLRSAILAAGGLLLVASPLLARTWHITPDGSGDAPTIQAGVDSAAAGDTVAVACGGYYEHDIVVPTPLGGGAIAQYVGSTARFDRCLIVGNEAWRGSALEFFLDDAGETIVSDCTIVANVGAYEAIRVRAGGPDGSASPDFENTVIAFHEEPSLDVSLAVTSPPQLTGCDVFGNTGGDRIDPIADQLGVRGNTGADPLFCDSDAGDFHLQWGSPCLPANSGGCGPLGRYGFGGCNSVSVTSETWGRIKAAYRAKPLRWDASGRERRYSCVS